MATNIEPAPYTKTGRDLRSFVSRLLKQKGVETSFRVESDFRSPGAGCSRFRVIFDSHFEDHCRAAGVDPVDGITEEICTYVRNHWSEFGRTVGYHRTVGGRVYRQWTPYNEIECAW